jgi:hypothetical protein
MDNIKVIILPNGDLKLETDQVSMANHTNAENLLRELEKLGGGLREVRHKKRSVFGWAMDKIKGHEHHHHHGHGPGEHTH